MIAQDIEKAVFDKSISDKKFFKILLKYLNDQEISNRESKKDISSINSPAYKKIEAEIDHLRTKVEKLRPGVTEMLMRHVLKQHERCCLSKRKK